MGELGIYAVHQYPQVHAGVCVLVADSTMTGDSRRGELTPAMELPAASATHCCSHTRVIIMSVLLVTYIHWMLTIMMRVLYGMDSFFGLLCVCAYIICEGCLQCMQPSAQEGVAPQAGWGD